MENDGIFLFVDDVDVVVIGFGVEEILMGGGLLEMDVFYEVLMVMGIDVCVMGSVIVECGVLFIEKVLFFGGDDEGDD